MSRKILFLMLSLLCLSGRSFDFSRDGRALCVIAVPETLTDLEIIARDDLTGFLKKITGAEFQVVPESRVTKQPAIYLGFTEYAAKKGLSRKSFAEEEWAVKTCGKNLILTGGGRIGPFYAVTSLLRKLGCYTLTMDQEIYPRKPTLSLQHPDERRQPAFAGRSIYDVFSAKAYYDHITYEDAKAYNMYLLRNFRNGCGQSHKNFLPYYTGSLYNFSQNPEFHSLMLFVPPEKYFAAHPEYYSLDQYGKRVKPRGLTAGGCLCMSNPEVARVVSQNMLAMIKKERQTVPPEFCSTIYDFSLLDNFKYICHCPECRKIIQEGGGENNGGNTYLMLKLANQIARNLAAEYPEITLRIFAYSCCRQPPSIPVKIEKNLLVQYCDLFASGDAYRPLTSKFNHKALNLLQGWGRTGASLMVWDYWNLPSQTPRPETVIDTIQPDLQLFKKQGVKSLFIEAEIQQYCPQNFMLLQYFVGAQLMENPDRNLEELIDIYLKGYYGPAAPLMREYLDTLRQGVKTHPNTQITIRVEHWHYLTPEFVMSWYQRMSRLAKTLPEKSPYRFRLQMEKLPLLWTICLSSNAYSSRLTSAGLTVKQMKKECTDLSHAFFYRHNYKSTRRRKKDLTSQLDLFNLELPVPEIFREVPKEQMHIFGYPDYRTVASLNVKIVEDPEAICKKAVKSAYPGADRHGVAKMYKSGANTYCATEFFLSNIDYSGPDKRVSLKLKEIPLDEKYHWYRFPAPFNMNVLPYFWAHGWGIQVNISRAYVVDDGISDSNRWDGWFRAKFTGPAYVPGSKQDNAVWFDTLILTRPGTPSLKKYPSEGLIQ